MKPPLAATGNAEAAGLGIRPEHCKRLLPAQADPDVGSGMFRGAPPNYVSAAAGGRLPGAVIAGHRGDNTPQATPEPPQNRANRRPERARSVTEGQNWRYPPLMTRNDETSPPAAPAKRGITGEPAGPRAPGTRMTRDHRLQRHPKDPPEAKPNRETNRPRHHNTSGAGNLKTDEPMGRGTERKDENAHSCSHILAFRSR